MNNTWNNKKFVATGFRMDAKDNSKCPRRAQPFLFKHNENIFIYYEKYDDNMKWEIGCFVIKAEDFPSGKWQNFPAILASSNASDAPDGHSIADPVVLYIDKQYHMWFDMLGENSDWTLGHAVSSDGIYWKKQQNKKTTAVLLERRAGEWDNQFVHAPEVYVWNNELRFIYNATDKNNNWFAGLMQLKDPTNLNSKFVRLKRLTSLHTLPTHNTTRLYAPFWYKGYLWAVLSGQTGSYPTDFFFMICEDGEDWKVICRVPDNLMLHSFLVHKDKLYGICQKDQLLYQLEE